MSNFVVVFGEFSLIHNYTAAADRMPLPVTPVGLNSIQGNYYWVWAIVNASFVPLVYFFGVETAGRSLVSSFRKSCFGRAIV